MELNQGAQNCTTVVSNTGLNQLQWSSSTPYIGSTVWAVYIRKVENGYILSNAGKEYAYKTIVELSKALEKVSK